MISEPTLALDPSLAGANLRLALVWADGLSVSAREGPGTDLAELLGKVKASPEWLTPARRAAVRDMLRHGVYKPAGRAKPSSEYLAAAALEGNFPFVNGPVDANNAASLEFGYPASVFDLAKCGTDLLVRRGGQSDSYVFNPSGQSIALEDLICVWRRGDAGAWVPIGNPVKDAMETKVHPGCSSVVAVIYAPGGAEGGDLEACAERLASLLKNDCGAADVAWRLP